VLLAPVLAVARAAVLALAPLAPVLAVARAAVLALVLLRLIYSASYQSLHLPRWRSCSQWLRSTFLALVLLAPGAGSGPCRGPCTCPAGARAHSGPCRSPCTGASGARAVQMFDLQCPANSHLFDLQWLGYSAVCRAGSSCAQQSLHLPLWRPCSQWLR
jgi:hypothetical protein